VQDIEQYNRLPYYLALIEATYMPKWTVWDKLFGKQKWEPNMGDILKAVIAEPTPVQAAMFFPNDITTTPKKDVFTVMERTESARVKRHLYESPYFSFLPSFRDFRQNQIQFAAKDITQQIALKNDMFIRSAIFHRSPFVFISGRTGGDDLQSAVGDELVNAPVGDGSDDGSSGKTTAWLQEACTAVGSSADTGYLSYKVIRKVKTILCEDMQAPPFSGIVNTPADNETIKGKWVLITSNEAFEALSFDNFILQNRPLMMNLINDEFSGVIGSHIAVKIERFPIRIKADGTIPGPQTCVTNPESPEYGMTIPNPDYVNAPFEVAFMVGADAYKSIAVGPPPKEFVSKSMDEQKFRSLTWNGEIKLTDDLLINYGENRYDTNKYGEYLQLIASTVHGILPLNRRYVIPIIYRRRRVQTN
jgi:hypothetical protein